MAKSLWFMKTPKYVRPIENKFAVFLIGCLSKKRLPDFENQTITGSQRYIRNNTSKYNILSVFVTEAAFENVINQH